MLLSHEKQQGNLFSFFLRDDSDKEIVSNQPCDESKYCVEWKFEKTENIEIL